MQPTAAPWAKRPPSDGGAAQAPLPPVSRGETTTAPWAARPAGGAAAALTGRPVDVAVRACPRFPAPIDPDTHAFKPAGKRITSAEHLRRFLTSPSAHDFVGFLLSLNAAVKGRQLSDACPASEGIAALLAVLDTLGQWVDEVPPAPHSLRYGNPAFRVWFARLRAGAPALVATVLPPALRRADVLSEMAPYLVDSFGNDTRIDYGTGHETTFAALLFCLARAGAVQPSDAAALVTRVFARYLSLMRRVQTTYWLEPAGSHGVWGLDDYQFLPFVWGSAQLVEHPYLKPSAVLDPAVLESEAEEYLYLSCVRFVRQVKKGPLGETSPMLCDVSAVPSWTKVNAGMMKMYQAEVLGKLPIMQHFLFGSLLPFPEGDGGKDPGAGDPPPPAV